jgi:hypothetical protein
MGSSKIPRICRVCGVEFLPANSKSTLCSHACRDQARRVKEKINCASCEEKFEISPWQKRRRANLYCSHSCYALSLRKTLRERFWGFVTKTEYCWLWTGPTNNKGYGYLQIAPPSGKKILAHRLSYEIHNNSIPGKVTRHTCDNPPCVNPAHLISGTQNDNMADCASKDRTCFGERNGQSKLTNEIVKEMRTQHAKGDSISALGRKYNVNRMTARSAIRGETWKRVV